MRHLAGICTESAQK